MFSYLHTVLPSFLRGYLDYHCSSSLIHAAEVATWNKMNLLERLQLRNMPTSNIRFPCPRPFPFAFSA